MLYEDLFSFHTYGAKNTWMFVRTCCSDYGSIVSINPNPSYKRNIKEEWFIQRYYSKLCLLLLLLLARKYLGNLFLKWFFSSIDAVLTCTFRDTFLLKPQLRRIQGICEYNDILYRVSLWLTSPVLWSNHNYFLLVLT